MTTTSKAYSAYRIQLYFDRVHPIIPILNKPKTFRWMNDSHNMSDARQCLQCAMWTSATAFSSQFGGFQETMYAKTRYLLDQLDLHGNDALVCQIEHVQAWILITFYEFSRTNYRRGWLSAGRVFRLVQLLRLYDLDSPKPLGPDREEDPISTEEKRRTFWVAYCLDRFISVSEGAPMTLNEEVVSSGPSAQAPRNLCGGLLLIPILDRSTRVSHAWILISRGVLYHRSIS